MTNNYSVKAQLALAAAQGRHYADFGITLGVTDSGDEALYTYLYDNDIKVLLDVMHQNLSNWETVEALVNFSQSDFDELDLVAPEISVETSIPVVFLAPTLVEVQEQAAILALDYRSN